MATRKRRDVVTLAVREEVLARDGWRCVAPTLDPSAGNCMTDFGDMMEYPGGYNVTHLELHHVKDQPMMGKRAESDADHLVTLCPWHHKYSGWGTSKHGLGLLREYLRRHRGERPPTAEADAQLAFPKRDVEP
jgi:hypothetical protein